MFDTPFADVQKAAGALFSESRTSAPRAVHYGDPRAEYEAARQEAVLFEVNDRTQIEITGGDRVKFLNNFCTNDIRPLQPGQGCEAFITNVKGRVLGHVFVFVAPDSIWLETVAGAEDSLIAQLDRYLITEDAALHGRTAECGEILATGPQAAAKLEALQIAVDSLKPYEHAAIATVGHPLFARRVDWLGQAGYLLSVPREHLEDLWNRLVEGGIRPAGSEVFDALRIEAGFPLYGIDVTDDQLAQEVARTQQAISFTKGCYLGQEPIARIDALGHVNRELRGLRLSSGPVPEPGASIVAGEPSKEIGTITSATLSYETDLPVALGYLRSQYVQPGASVTVKTEEAEIPATVFLPEAH